MTVIGPFKVIQGQILVPIKSPCATSYQHIILMSYLCFRAIAAAYWSNYSF